MGGKIEAYLDCTSFYAFLGYVHLIKHRELLESHGVEVEVFPVFLGGINVGSGNKPPWTLPAKAKYSNFDTARAKYYFGLPKIETPPFFPILTILPQRAMYYIKEHFSRDKYEAVFLSLFHALWSPPQIDISKPENLSAVLSKHFNPDEVSAVLNGAASAEYKTKLTDITKKVVEEQGAFGCPWFWVTNPSGQEEPFFGSDRFHFMWEYLGLPWQDFKLLPAQKTSKL